MQPAHLVPPPVVDEAAHIPPPTGPATPIPQTRNASAPHRPPVLHDGSGTLAAFQSLSYIIVVAIFTVTFSLQPFRIPSASMEPTLLVGDFLLVDKEEPASRVPLSHTLLDPFPSSPIRRGDVIVFHYPVDPSLHLVKRVIGLPGERLRMRNGRVFINDIPLPEPYALYTRSRRDTFRDDFPHLESTDPDVSSQWWSRLQRLVDHGDLRIPSGEYFVLGDNRNDSEDSRYWGLVPRAAIVGEPFLVYFSLRDPGGQADLLRDSPGRQTGPTGHRTPAEILAGLARWDRVLHVIR